MKSSKRRCCFSSCVLFVRSSAQPCFHGHYRTNDWSRGGARSTYRYTNETANNTTVAIEDTNVVRCKFCVRDSPVRRQKLTQPPGRVTVTTVCHSSVHRPTFSKIATTCSLRPAAAAGAGAASCSCSWPKFLPEPTEPNAPQLTGFFDRWFCNCDHLVGMRATAALS